MLRLSRWRSQPTARSWTDESPVEVAVGEIPRYEWRVIVTARPNILIEGPAASAETLVRALATFFREPLLHWNQPWPVDRAAIVIVRAVDKLDADQQRGLLEHLDASVNKPHRRQVISTSEESVFPLVQQGSFPADLYYRLNAVRLEVGEKSASQTRRTAGRVE